MGDGPDRLVAALARVLESARRYGAVNPALWALAIGVGGVVIVAVAGREVPPVLVWIAGLTAVVYAVGFGVLLAVDRDRLHSEDHQLRKQALELVRERGTRKTIEAASLRLLWPDEKPKSGGPEGQP